VKGGKRSAKTFFVPEITFRVPFPAFGLAFPPFAGRESWGTSRESPFTSRSPPFLSGKDLSRVDEGGERERKGLSRLVKAGERDAKSRERIAQRKNFVAELLGKPIPPEEIAEILGWSPEDGDFSKTDLELA